MRQIDPLDHTKIEEGTFMPLHKNSNRKGIGVRSTAGILLLTVVKVGRS